LFRKGRVPLNNDVMMKCMCPTCPVQTESACSRPKIKMMMDMMEMKAEKSGSSSATSGMGMSMMPERTPKMEMNPSDMPGPYCTIGVAACKDLDDNKACICRSCQVYKEYNLMQARPVEHFCFNDKAV
jgi:hypothetical protein